MCPIPNVFRDRVISLCSCKIVDKEILLIVFNIGIYCSSDKVGTAYIVAYNTFSKISPSTSMQFATLLRSWCVAHLCASWHSFMLAVTSIMRSINSSRVSTLFCPLHSSSNPINKNRTGRSTAGVKDNTGRQIETPVQWNSSISETVRNRKHVHTHVFA
jgi:hypothetical protein